MSPEKYLRKYISFAPSGDFWGQVLKYHFSGDTPHSALSIKPL